MNSRPAAPTDPEEAAASEATPPMSVPQEQPDILFQHRVKGLPGRPANPFEDDYIGDDNEFLYDDEAWSRD